MNFRQRFLRYGIGVIIGLFLSFFFFGERGCNWMPSKRIKSRMQLDGVVPDAQLSCLIDCEGLAPNSMQDVEAWLLDCEVNFSASHPRQNIPCYHLEMPEESPFTSLQVCFLDSVGLLSNPVLRDGQFDRCNCDTTLSE